MNGKIKAVFMLAFVCGMLLACRTTAVRTSDDVIAYQRKLDRLEETVRKYDEAVGGAVSEIEAITRRSKDMGSTIDGTIELFDSYQRVIERILRDYYNIRLEAENQN